MNRLARKILRSGGQDMRLKSIFALVAASVLLLGQAAFAKQENSLLAIGMDAKASQPTVVIETEKPVGYSYTVYDSFDPVRVVVDFPGMDVAMVKPEVTFDNAVVKGARVSSFDLESGKLGRVELMLAKSTEYDVKQSDGKFQVIFKGAQSSSIGRKLTGSLAEQKPAVASPASKPAATPSKDDRPAAPKAAATDKAPRATVAKAAPAVTGGEVSFAGVAGAKAEFVAPGMDRYQFFRLAGPPRLVVDIYGVKPAFSQRSFPAAEGFSRLRVGVYKDKTRFVFDAENGNFPAYDVSRAGDSVIVDWSGAAVAKSAAKETAPRVQAKPVTRAKARPAVESAPVAVEALDFDSDNGKSTFVVTLSGPGQLIPAVQDGDLVRFGVANASISRSLRRVVDTSSFPSAVKLITPYIVQNKGVQEVRFTAELKGPVPYKVKQDGNRIVFTTDDGAFAEFAPPAAEKVAVEVEPTEPAKPSAGMAETIEAVIPEQDQAAEAGQVELTEQGTLRLEQEKPKYTGEKITLIFDNADIRQIMQLIADVSGLNIIASDEVKGTITLRLIDVPWDQALDLIMDIKDLGMLRDGNVARILPRARIRSMEEAKLTAKRTKEKLEDLVTEVIMVSHTDLGNVAGPAGELLTERGKITQDARNKQIIVTDVPSAIEKIRQLVKILDTPERQVLIESRIVEANSNFARDVGVKWGYSYDQQRNGASGSKFAALDNASAGLGGSFLISPGSITSGSSSGLGTSFTFGRLGIDSSVLDLRISALETAGHGKVVSQPRIATLNGEAAMISQGTKIPYQSVSDEGTETKFENAELKLEVTPVINPDDTIILDIVASNSSVGATVPTGVGDAIAIDEKKAETKVLVRDGETTVIGGIFVEDDRLSESGVPILMHVPIVGHLFKSTTKTNERRELLIFITPRILQ